MSHSPLHAEDSWFKQLFELSPDPTWIIDDHRFVACNEAAIQTLGYRSREEFLNVHPSKLSPPRQPDGEDSYAKAERMMTIAWNQHLHRFEWTHTKADGTSFVAEVTLSTIELRERKVLYCVWRDITERKQAVERLQEHDAYLTAIIENQPGLLWLKDVKGRFLATNHAFDVSCGRETQGVLGKTDLDIWPREVAMKYIADDAKVMQAGRPIVVEEIIYDKNEAKWFETFKTPVRDAHGNVIGSTGYARDITERKRSEQELRAAEEQFRGLVEQSIAGIYIIQDGAFAYVNPRFAEILGYASTDEMIGLDRISTIAEKDRGVVAENMRRLLAGETRSLDYTFTAARKGGSNVEVGVHSALASYRGRPAIIGLMQDITEKKRAEAEILRYSMQLKNAFMRTVEVATNLSEMRDPYTSGHERRVADIAVAIGAELGFDEHRQEGLRVAGLLHDVGKITIPAEILSKPGKLSAIEFQLIQGHAQASYDILKNVEFPWPVAEVALQHHERTDGSGYPQGLKGEAIRIEARIMAVADVVEAMSSHRPYRAGLGIDKALAEIERGRGTAYDQTVVDACLKLHREKGYTIPA